MSRQNRFQKQLSALKYMEFCTNKVPFFDCRILRWLLFATEKTLVCTQFQIFIIFITVWNVFEGAALCDICL